MTKSRLSSCRPVNLTFPELVGKMGKQLVTEARMKLKVLGLSRYETDLAGMKRIMVPKKSRFSFFFEEGWGGVKPGTNNQYQEAFAAWIFERSCAQTWHKEWLLFLWNRRHDDTQHHALTMLDMLGWDIQISRHLH